MSSSGHRPKFSKFHESLSHELRSIQDRIKDLVGHAATSGAFKEAALRAVIRRHAPPSVIVGHGFIVTKDKASTEIDILIVDGRKPTLFRDGDLMIVTPDAALAVIEVKSELRFTQPTGDEQGSASPGIACPDQVIRKLIKVEKLCRNGGGSGLWTGVYVFKRHRNRHRDFLSAAGRAWLDYKIPLDCVCCGSSTFVRYWGQGSCVNSPIAGPVWHAYDLPDLAPAYFVGNLVDSISSVDHVASSHAWFPVEHGKETHRKFYLAQGETEPQGF